MLRKILFTLFWFFYFFSIVFSQEKIKGIWYIDLSSKPYKNTSGEDLKRIKETGANYIFLLANLSQENYKSNNLSLPEYQEGLKKVIKLAKETDLKVSLTMFLLCRDGKWRGEISPENIELWFKNYERCVIYYAKLAQNLKVDIFCIGSEMETLKQESKYWKNLIKKVKNVYSGKIIYNTNWWAHPLFLEEIIKKMDWIKNLDYFGISSYFELTDKNNPTVEELKKAWVEKDILQGFEKIYKKFNKEIIIWEIGYTSTDGTNKKPWDFQNIKRENVEADEEEQSDCFEAFFETFKNLEFIRGYSVWGENVGLKSSKKGYNILGKKAEKIVRKYYKEL